MSDEKSDATAATAAKEAMPSWRTRRPKQTGAPAGGGAVYGLGTIGALVYFLQSAESGWDYMLAVPRASVWPALLVYKLLKSMYG